jgi:hypothetical protein
MSVRSSDRQLAKPGAAGGQSATVEGAAAGVAKAAGFEPIAATGAVKTAVDKTIDTSSTGSASWTRMRATDR